LEPMSIFRFSRSDRFIKKLILSVSLIMVLAIAISMDLKKTSPAYFQNPVLYISYWVETAGHALFKGISGIWSNYISLIQTHEKYIQLQKDFEVLNGENSRLKEIQLENERLRKLLDIPLPLSLKPIAAEVILRDTSNWYKSLTINKGNRDGIQSGMGVITPSGIVGRVLKTGSRSAIVQLITDRNSAVAAVISRTRDEGVLEGTARGLARIKYLSLDLKLLPGDQVLTSGLTPTFPRGLVIGTVVRMDQKPELDEKKRKEVASSDPFLSVEVVPAVNFSRLEEVMVIPQSSLPEQVEPVKK
jgi:rod shape-determining protein MreC